MRATTRSSTSIAMAPSARSSARTITSAWPITWKSWKRRPTPSTCALKVMDSDSREAQMRDLSALTAEVDRRGIKVELVADEWCNTLEDVKYFADNRAGHMIQIKTPDLGSIHNTVEAVLYCEQVGVGAYQGGTCNETDRSAQVCVHCAMATKPMQILAKPGMGVDEGIMICYNEMNRILALRKAGQGVAK